MKMNATEKKLFLKVPLLLLGILVFWISGCKHDPVISPATQPTISTHCNADTVYFQNEILPLLVSNCATSGCHNNQSHKHGIVLVDYATVMNTGEINLSNPSSSKIYEAIIGSDEKMPPSPATPLTSEQTNKVLKWIEQGALNNQCVEDSTQCDTTNVTFNADVKPIFEKYCLGCHSQPTPAYNIDLNNWDDLAVIVNSGSLVGSVKHAAGYYPMPKGSTMTDCEIATVVKWANDTTLTDPGGGGGGGGGGGNPDPCDPDTTYFQNTVLPLIVSNCATSGCHDTQTHQHGIILVDYASIVSGGKVKPGNPSGSKLYKVLFGGDQRDDIMPPPPNQPFSTNQKQIVYDWILQGALNNSCNGGCDTTNVTFSGTVWPLMQTWCTGCHSGGNAGGSIHIENYNNLVAIANNGKLIGTITHSAGYSPMPKNNDKLSDCQIAEIRIWIEAGTPNN